MKLNLKKLPELHIPQNLRRRKPTQEERAQQARERLNEMIRVLVSIDFETGNLNTDICSKNEYEEVRSELIDGLKNPPITRDDMTRIDNVLLYACYSLEEAAKTGMETVAEWSLYCLVGGLRDVRRDLPALYASDPKAREKLIRARDEWFETYRTIIGAYAGYEGCEKVLRDLEYRRNEVTREFDEQQEKMNAFLETAEGQRAEEKLGKDPADPDLYSDESVVRLIVNLNSIYDKKQEIERLNLERAAKLNKLNRTEANINRLRDVLNNGYI